MGAAVGAWVGDVGVAVGANVGADVGADLGLDILKVSTPSSTTDGASRHPTHQPPVLLSVVKYSHCASWTRG